MGKKSKRHSTKKEGKALSNQSSSKGNDDDDDNDDRFDVSSKPQFRVSSATGANKQHRKSTSNTTTTTSSSTKVVLDARFASVLTDPRFQLDIHDKYGRTAAVTKTKQSGSKQKGQKQQQSNRHARRLEQQQKELGEFYTIASAPAPEDQELPSRRGDHAADKEVAAYSVGKDDAADGDRSLDNVACHNAGDDESPASNDTSTNASKEDEEKEENEEDTDEQAQDLDPASRIAYLTALSRGQVMDLPSSSEEEEEESDEDSNDDSDESLDDENKQQQPGILDPSSHENEEESIMNEATPYLAVTNMDWSHVRAVDIFAILSSFTPPLAVKRVQVYTSDFGQEMLAKEVSEGPKLWKKKNNKNFSSKSSKQSNRNQEDEESDKSRTDDDQNEEDEDESDKNSNENQGGASEKDEDEYLSDTVFEPEDMLPKNQSVDSDIDPERLRDYEASKLKYYFAVVEFSKPEFADIAYKEVDGMEFEHSSAAVDLRAIPEAALAGVITDRPLRDEADRIPSSYEPPDFVVSALQQTNVQCTWEAGDVNREKTLTKYTSGEAWRQLAESDDLRAYVASDNSSDNEDDEKGEVDAKAARIRKMLGLESGDEGDSFLKHDEGDEEDSVESSPGSDDGPHQQEEVAKAFSYVPGKRKEDLKERIRFKIQMKGEHCQEELTPWQQYQEKRKQKRRERRQAARVKQKEVSAARKGATNTDEFLLNEDDNGEDQPMQSKEDELELLVAGDDSKEEKLDFNMRELERMEKNKGKKLRGSRKRKQEVRSIAATGADFKVNIEDERFKAVLDGADDRFGIDRTDPNFKETAGMKEILTAQRRRKKRKTKASSDTKPEDIDADSTKPTPGSSALSALVKSIKAKVQG